MKDQRGRHGNHAKVDENIRKDAKAFIEAIPKIDSHYTRARSKRHFIDGSKTIADIHRDYAEQCKAQNKPFATYVTFYRIFTTEFNISFFIPKKDLSDVCEAHKNSTDEEKEANKENYETHIKEKQLSRLEKESDKNSSDTIVAVYDLEAVFQCPKGEISVFYYKSKLNVLNLTVYNIKTNVAECYVWDESNANRGVNEIGTCVFNYLTNISETGTDLNVVFYSDNCAGQQKNKFMISMYLYAVQNLPNIKSITHKYLIKGHTQNEGDSVHSQIEREIKRQLRSGPMYTPDAFVGAIKAARKKSTPFKVYEMCYEDFYDWKSLCTHMNFTLNKDEDNKPIKLMGAKVIRVQKDTPNAIFLKDSYAKNNFQKAVVLKKQKDGITEMKRAYTVKPGISEKKKGDLMDLMQKKLIPRCHRPFYEAL